MINISIFRYKLDLKTPFRIAHGTYAFRENVFVTLERDGHFGFGEAAVVPYYGVSPESVEKDIRKGVSGGLTEEILVNLGRDLKDRFEYPVSFCALQSALINLLCSLKDKSCAETLGIGGGREKIPTSFTVDYREDPEEMLKAASSCGFRNLKVKAGLPGDVERIKYIKDSLPGVSVRVDANQGWTLKEAVGKIAALEKLGVELIEEPAAAAPGDIEKLASGTSVPIIMDESIKNSYDLRRFLYEAPSIAGLVVKNAKTGGPAESLSLIREARRADLKVMLSSMVESSLGIASALPLAPLCTWVDLDAPLLLARDPFSGLDYEEERPVLFKGGLVPSDEFLAASGAPGERRRK